GTLISEFGVLYRAPMTKGLSEVLARLGEAVGCAGRDIVLHPIPAVAREPQLIGLGMPGKAHGIANALGYDFPVASIRVHPGNGGKALILPTSVADIAGRPHGDIQFSIGPKGYVFPSVVEFRRVIRIDGLGLRGVIQMRSEEHTSELQSREKLVCR